MDLIVQNMQARTKRRSTLTSFRSFRSCTLEFMADLDKRHCGFAPIARPNARHLILGSLPGAVSLERCEYYAHPRNLFWPMMASLLGFDQCLSYEVRITALRDAQIALWDVCASAYRVGSLDTAIKHHAANDFTNFFAAHPRIDRIFFNGRKAANIYASFVLRDLPPRAQAIPAAVLPSTSPANASTPLGNKLLQWRAVIASS